MNVDWVHTYEIDHLSMNKIKHSMTQSLVVTKTSTVETLHKKHDTYSQPYTPKGHYSELTSREEIFLDQLLS